MERGEVLRSVVRVRLTQRSGVAFLEVGVLELEHVGRRHRREHDGRQPGETRRQHVKERNAVATHTARQNGHVTNSPIALRMPVPRTRSAELAVAGRALELGERHGAGGR